MNNKKNPSTKLKSLTNWEYF